MIQCYLQIDGLTKSFGDLILFENVSLGINEGDRVGLIARNGSGKTTLLNIIMGDEDKDAGTIIFRNDLKVGYLSQNPHFPEGVTVGDECGDNALMVRILTQLKVTDMKQPVAQLSGGQRKRLALAKVLSDEPQFLI